MTTTDKPLSAADLRQIRRRHDQRSIALAIDRDFTIDEEVEMGQDMDALLRHLDALTPPAVPPPLDREQGGRLVRKVWIAWAREQPSPKASWLVPWKGLSEPDREVDRRIFEACAAIGYAAGAASRDGEVADVPLPSDMFGPCLCAAHSGGDDPGCSECHPPTAREMQRRYEAALVVRDAEIARLTRENANQLEAWRVSEGQRTRGLATIERLTGERDTMAAELAEARATLDARIRARGTGEGGGG